MVISCNKPRSYEQTYFQKSPASGHPQDARSCTGFRTDMTLGESTDTRPSKYVSVEDLSRSLHIPCYHPDHGFNLGVVAVQEQASDQRLRGKPMGACHFVALMAKDPGHFVVQLWPEYGPLTFLCTTHWLRVAYIVASHIPILALSH